MRILFSSQSPVPLIPSFPSSSGDPSSFFFGSPPSFPHFLFCHIRAAEEAFFERRRGPYFLSFLFLPTLLPFLRRASAGFSRARRMLDGCLVINSSFARPARLYARVFFLFLSLSAPCSVSLCQLLSFFILVSAPLPVRITTLPH